ncbi:Single-stranded DNA-binding protein (Ssb) [Fructobacillus tropaeoli]|uniref:single-stranded DNA-binding protein n=1 Tax=Fructobacillus tropaeoli TaxID=709323 RepID=UPI002D92F152|nr:Single-stranded DNA-binding protein (Ssb) [Fructobacillus tropaeoli]
MINRVTLIGRVTRDIEPKYTNNGTAVASFSLAVERDFKNQNGEKETDFFNVVTWRKGAEIVAQYAGKGSLLAVEGRLETRQYENRDGQKVNVVEVNADRFQFLDSKKDTQRDPFNQQQAQPKQEKQDDFISDSDLPF